MYYYIVYSSITFATGMKNKFRYDREQITVMHTPAVISKTGCSYCLKLKSLEKAREIIAVSEEYGIKIKGLYKQIGTDEFVKIQ